MNFRLPILITCGILLLDFAAFAQIPSDAYLRIQVSSLSETNLLVTISNTIGDVQYEIQRKQGKTNWVSMGFILGSETTNWVALDFKITNAINSKTIRVRSWIDSDNVGIPDWWQLKYFGVVGINPYGNPEGDGWVNLRKYANGMDPFTCYEPPKSASDVKFYEASNNPHKGRAILSAQIGAITTKSIRKTILHVTTKQMTNGYDLAVSHPIPSARYLLLVRDKNDRQWRASGYFFSGTNRNPVFLHVDKKGMMSDGQSPIAMPAVKFLSDVVQPEFTAGWGEDSDGDGLPDVYEVLVTHTEPDNEDTGNTGVLDGEKKMTSDDWCNLEKFWHRADPLKLYNPPQPLELQHPTWVEYVEAAHLKVDLPFEFQIQIRTNGATNYQPVEQLPLNVFHDLNSGEPFEHRNFDMRISWQVSTMLPQETVHRP
jgi:hypothetical protein